MLIYELENPGKYAPNLEKSIITETNYPKYKNSNQWGEVYEATKKAIDRLEGDCLELSAGTGRNTSKMLKNPKITSVLATDIDPRPLEILYENVLINTNQNWKFKAVLIFWRNFHLKTMLFMVLLLQVLRIFSKYPTS